MINSFGTPLVACSSHRARRTRFLAQLLESWRGSEFPHVFPPEFAVQINSAVDLVHFLEGLHPDALRNLAFVIDLEWLPSPQEWDLTWESHPLSPVEMIMQFPEVYWIFLVPALPNLADALHAKSLPAEIEQSALKERLRTLAIPSHFVPYDHLSTLLGLLERHAKGFRPLFDPYSLRFFLEIMTIPEAGNVAVPFEEIGHAVPQLGLALEDESSFCWFHGYLLYRYGRSVSLAPTYKALQNWKVQFQSQVSDPGQSSALEKIALIEDAELSFADVSDAVLRDQSLMPGDVSHETMLDERWKQQGWSLRLSPRVVCSAVKLNRDGESILKPHGGVFDKAIIRSLWKPCPRRLEAPTEPIKFAVQKTASTSSPNNHSASGKIQEVAANLLRRVRAGIDDVRNSDQAIHYAALALAARRILGFRTIHLSLDAIRLQHQMEVEAETTFIGTDNDLDVNLRIAAIQDEISDIVWRRVDGGTRPQRLYWGNVRTWWRYKMSLRTPVAALDEVISGAASRAREPKRHRQLINAMLETCSSLRDVYHKHDQIDDENDVVRHFLIWQNRFYRRPREINDRRSWFSTVLIRVLTLPLWYLNTLRSSLQKLFFVSAAWVMLFGLLFWLLAAPIPALVHTYPSSWVGHLAYWFGHSAATFLGMQQSFGGGVSPDSLAAQIEKLYNAGSSTVYLRKRLNWWWGLYIVEISLGYVHLAVFIAQLSQRLSRR